MSSVDPAVAVERYLALSYGPEEEEFNQCDEGLVQSCKNESDHASHIRQISDTDDFLVFERQIGIIVHKFRSKFVISPQGEKVPQQFTEIWAPQFPGKALIFPLKKELGEAGCMFQSALVLANFMADEKCELSKYMNGDHRLVELGCGTGLLGIVVAQVGQNITLTDLPHVMTQIRANVEANLDEAAASRVSIAPLAWGDEVTEKAVGLFDLVLCSDLIYKEETKEALVHTLVALTKPSSVVAMAFERRRKAVEDSFMAHAGQFFDAEELAIPYPEENGVMVYLMHPKPR